MSYTPTTWAAGDTVTSAKLNKIEQGIVANEHPVIKLESDASDNLHTISSVNYNNIAAARQKGILPFASIFKNGGTTILSMTYQGMYDDIFAISFANPIYDISITLGATTQTALLHLPNEEEIEPGEQSGDEPEPIPFDKPDIGEAR